MKKCSVFADKKGPLRNGYATPTNISSISSSLFDNSFQQQNLLGATQNCQLAPTNTRRLPHFHHHILQSHLRILERISYLLRLLSVQLFPTTV